VAELVGRNRFLLRELLERINSSCSSGRERRKSASGMKIRLMRPHLKAIWKWSSIALQMSVLSYEDACASAARNGHLEVLKYLREEAKAPWDSWTATRAAQNGHLHILEYLVERKYDEYHELACLYAAEKGHLDCLKYLHETAKAPWDSQAVRGSAREQTTECLQYLLDNNCPLPRGWRYEHGVLHET